MQAGAVLYYSIRDRFMSVVHTLDAQGAGEAEREKAGWGGGGERKRGGERGGGGKRDGKSDGDRER